MKQRYFAKHIMFSSTCLYLLILHSIYPREKKKAYKRPHFKLERGLLVLKSIKWIYNSIRILLNRFPNIL